MTSFDASGDEGAPAADLPLGTVYWRLRGVSGPNASATASDVRQLYVRGGSLANASSWGAMPDYDGDGRSDLLVGDSGRSSDTGGVFLFEGTAAGLDPSTSTPILGLVAGGLLGASVAQVGDVDGDGYGDAVVGAYGANRAYVLFGGTTGLSTSLDTVLEFSDSFGRIVQGLGDTNGDGFADVAVGSIGRVEVFRGGPSGLASTPAHTYSSSNGNDFAFGMFMTAGDFDGDGFGDLAFSESNGSAVTGTRIYLGGSGGLTAADVIEGATSYLFAEDVDGDGFCDLLAADVFAVSNLGAVRVHYGSAAGLDASASSASVGSAMFSGFGIAAGFADLGRDGVLDLVVGAPNASSDSGVVQLYRSGTRGPSVEPLVPALGAGGVGERLGTVVGRLSDFDGDGELDVAVGARGHVRVHLANGDALSATPITLAAPVGATTYFGTAIGAR